jgi:omega-6 fatty acid desaturase (delta-12 desaturase)
MTLRSLAAVIPAACYERSAWRGFLNLGRDAAAYAVAVAALLSTDAAWLRPPLWALAAVAISALFVIGHDTAHGALFASPRLNRWVGRLAFLPSFHAYEVWAYGHNRLHHGHTGCFEIDFVWRPSTLTELAAQPGWARLLHRIEWSDCGAGLYYLRHVWWARMVRGTSPPRLRRAFRRDRLLVFAAAAGAATALAAIGWIRYQTVAAALWLPIEALVIPWLLFLQIIGFVVYLHHIGPDTVWLERKNWSKVRGRVDGTNSWRAPVFDLLWHNIFLHVAHHVDPRIPFYHLPLATRTLNDHCDVVRPKRLRLRDYLRIARRCKLYDFERDCWTDYDGHRAATWSNTKTNLEVGQRAELDPTTGPLRSSHG